MATFAKLNVALTSTASSLISGLKSAAVATIKLGTITKKVGAGLSAAFTKIKSKVIGILSPLKRLGRGLLGLLNPLKSVVGAFGAFIAIRGIIRLVSRVELFNQAMRRSTAIMGTLSKRMTTTMRTAAMEVGKTTQFSAREAGEAYFFLASAGLSAEQSILSLAKVAKFAQAGNFDLATATDLLTDAQSALGLSSKNSAQHAMNMARVSDVLLKANTLANASVEQFSTSITNKAGVSLRLVNKDIEEGVAVLSAFADQGVKAEEAGTMLDAMLRELAKKSQKFQSAFKKNKIAVFDLGGRMRKTADIVANFQKRMKGMSTMQTTRMFMELGIIKKGEQGIKMLIGLSDKIREYEAALRVAAGTTAEIGDNVLTPLQKAFFIMRGTVDQFLIVIGTPMVSALATLIDAFTNNFPTIVIFVANTLDTVRRAFEKFLSAFVNGLAILTSALQDLSEIKLFGKEIFSEEIAGTLGGWTNQLVSWRKSLDETIGGRINTPLWGDVIANMLEKANKELRRMKANIGELPATANAFSKVMEDLVKPLAVKAPEIKPRAGFDFAALEPRETPLLRASLDLLQAQSGLMEMQAAAARIVGMKAFEEQAKKLKSSMKDQRAKIGTLAKVKRDLEGGVAISPMIFAPEVVVTERRPEMGILTDIDDRIQRAIFKGSKEDEALEEQKRTRVASELTNVKLDKMAENALSFEN